MAHKTASAAILASISAGGERVEMEHSEEEVRVLEIYCDRSEPYDLVDSVRDATLYIGLDDDQDLTWRVMVVSPAEEVFPWLP